MALGSGGGVKIKIGADTSAAQRGVEEVSKKLQEAREAAEAAAKGYTSASEALAKYNKETKNRPRDEQGRFTQMAQFEKEQLKQRAASAREYEKQVRAIASAEKQLAAARENAIKKAFGPEKSSVDAFGNYNKSVNEATSGLSSMMGAARSLGPIVGGVTAAIGVGAVAMDQWSSSALDVQNTFNNLPFSIEAARHATSGLVTDMQLARSANSLAALGVAKTSEEFAQLANAAQALGSKLGLSTEEAFNSLGAALGRQSTLMLDNFGIVLKVEKAHEEYARTLGKTTSQLTEQEKAEAFRVVATRKIIEAGKQVTLVTDGAAAATQRYKVELENLATGALGGEDKTVSLKDAMLELAQKGLLPSNEAAKQYRESLVDLRDKLVRAGVTTEETFKTRPIEEWLRLMDQARTAARGLEQDMLLAGKSQTDAFAKIEAAVAESTRQTLNANLMFLEEQRVIAEGRNADQAELNLLAQDELQVRFMIAQLEGDATKQAELRHQIKLSELRSEAAATVAGGKGPRRGRGRTGPDPNEINAGRMMLLTETGRMSRDPRESMEALGGNVNGELAEIDFDTEIGRIQELEAAKAEAQLNERLRGLEMQKEMGVDPITLIDKEMAYRQEAIDKEITMLQQQAGNEAQILTLKDQREQVSHQARLQRMQAEAAARARQQKVIGDAFTSAASVIGQAQGLITDDSKKANKARAALEAVNLGITAMKLGIEGAADMATIVGIPQGLAKLAGAAIATAGIPMVLAAGNKSSPDGAGRAINAPMLGQAGTPPPGGNPGSGGGGIGPGVAPVSGNGTSAPPPPSTSTIGQPWSSVNVHITMDHNAEQFGIKAKQSIDRAERVAGRIR